ncbi:MAG TPA: ABC transporter permease subunit [Terracidiphilus sp.]|jgi:peptide/nickel transport system permease protein|nr:ABC transporter permease subunit [Terracidiphilus sp.]
MRRFLSICQWILRAVCVIALVMIGTTLLVRFAPGYLSDAREMDARYAGEAKVELSTLAMQSRSPSQMVRAEIQTWFHGDGGISRQYGVPVLELIGPRLAVSGSLLLRALGWSWLFAIAGALLSSSRRRPSFLWQVPFTLLLVIPTAALATVCLIAGIGGPVLVMVLCLAARDFKFLHSTLRSAWLDGHVLHARSQGLTGGRILIGHILPNLVPRLGALASLSIVTALSALVPVEVIFNVPGLGQLAWNAAVNRDLPVLLAATMIMAVAVTFAGMTRLQTTNWNNA